MAGDKEGNGDKADDELKSYKSDDEMIKLTRNSSFEGLNRNHRQIKR